MKSIHTRSNKSKSLWVILKVLYVIDFLLSRLERKFTREDRSRFSSKSTEDVEKKREMTQDFFQYFPDIWYMAREDLAQQRGGVETKNGDEVLCILFCLCLIFIICFLEYFYC